MAGSVLVLLPSFRSVLPAELEAPGVVFQGKEIKTERGAQAPAAAGGRQEEQLVSDPAPRGRAYIGLGLNRQSDIPREMQALSCQADLLVQWQAVPTLQFDHTDTGSQTMAGRRFASALQGGGKQQWKPLS